MRDKTGRLICAGDVVRQLHFRNQKGQRFWLYHTVVRDGNRLTLVPCNYLDPGTKDRNHGTGVCPLTDNASKYLEILTGFGEDGDDWWYERPRVRESGSCQ